MYVYSIVVDRTCTCTRIQFDALALVRYFRCILPSTRLLWCLCQHNMGNHEIVHLFHGEKHFSFVRSKWNKTEFTHGRKSAIDSGVFSKHRCTQLQRCEPSLQYEWGADSFGVLCQYLRFGFGRQPNLVDTEIIVSRLLVA